MKIVILSGGKLPSLRLIEKELIDSDCLICVDSGANGLFKYNIKPDYIMGDFDSIKEEVFKYYNDKMHCNIETFSTEKDFTDTQAAVKKAINLQADEIVLLGCTGTRLDHVLGNLGIMKMCLAYNIKVYIKDDNNTIMAFNRTTKIFGTPGETFSVQNFGSSLINLSIKGAKYELDNYSLDVGDPLTVSNEFLTNEVELIFDSGNLLVFYSRD